MTNKNEILKPVTKKARRPAPRQAIVVGDQEFANTSGMTPQRAAEIVHGNPGETSAQPAQPKQPA